MTINRLRTRRPRRRYINTGNWGRRVFATQEAAWAKLDENEPEGVAFQYEVIGCSE